VLSRLILVEAFSTGQRNKFSEFLQWCHIAESLSRPAIDSALNTTKLLPMVANGHANHKAEWRFAHSHSPRSTCAVEVRAALRPGNAATTFANTMVHKATMAIENAGTVGSGTT
jgi:hypothetical protein